MSTLSSSRPLSTGSAWWSRTTSGWARLGTTLMSTTLSKRTRFSTPPAPPCALRRAFDLPGGLCRLLTGRRRCCGRGGYAALYAPELNIKGTYAGAPPTDLLSVMNAVDGSSIVHVLGYAINGFAERPGVL